MADFLKIEYSNTKDFAGRVLYQNGFVNRIYLNTDVKRPTFPITEDGVENGNKDFIATFQKWEKRYSFTDHMAEYLVDAISLLPLHDSVWVTFKNGESNKIIDILVEVDWDDIGETEKSEGCFATVIVSFAVESIKKTSCDENMTIN